MGLFFYFTQSWALLSQQKVIALFSFKRNGLINMNTTHGYRKVSGMRIALPQLQACNQRPAPPDKTYNDRGVRCLGCPYPRHGMMCRGKDDEECLRIEMQKLEEKWLNDRQRKATVRNKIQLP